MKRFLGSRALWVAPAVAVVALYSIISWNSIPLPPSTQPASPAIAVLPEETPPVSEQPKFQFIEIIDSCDWSYTGECVNVRSGPGTNFPALLKLRNGVVLKVASTTVTDGRAWYKIGFTRMPRYPERMSSDWYVAGDYVRPFFDVGEQISESGLNASSTKRIIITRDEQILRAYDGDTIFMEQPISPGLELTPHAPRHVLDISQDAR